MAKAGSALVFMMIMMFHFLLVTVLANRTSLLALYYSTFFIYLQAQVAVVMVLLCRIQMLLSRILHKWDTTQSIPLFCYLIYQ